MSELDIRALNGVSLAFIGDAYMNLWVKMHLLGNGDLKVNILQKKSTGWLSAKAQCFFVHELSNQHFFNDEEWAIVLRGRNANAHTKAKNADIITYRWATGLEALVGWLYLNKQQSRLDELFEAIRRIKEDNQDESICIW